MGDENNLVKKKDVLLEIDEYFKQNPFYGLGNFMVKSVAKGAVDELYLSFMNENENYGDIKGSPECVASGAVHTAMIILNAKYKPKKNIREGFGVDENCISKWWGRYAKALELERYM